MTNQDHRQALEPINLDRKLDILDDKWTPLKSWDDFTKFVRLEDLDNHSIWPSHYPCLAIKRKASPESRKYVYRYLYRNDIIDLIRKLEDLL